jgi:hypothetical protein
MKSTSIKLFVILVVMLLTAVATQWYGKLNKDWRQQYAYAKGVDALTYAYPYFMNSALLYDFGQPVNPDKPPSASEAVNQFYSARDFTNPKNYQSGGMPNFDTLYSVAFVQIKDEPIILSVPPIPDERYYTVQIAGFDSDNYAYVGKRTHGNEGGLFALVPKGWKGQLPSGVTLLAEAPTAWSLLLLRQLANPNSSSDIEKVHSLQDQFRLTALSDLSKSNPPKPAHYSIPDLGKHNQRMKDDGFIALLKHIAVADPMFFWQVVNRAMAINGTPGLDKNRLVDWAAVQIGPNGDLSKLSESERRGLSEAVMDGIQILHNYSDNSEVINGWVFQPDFLGRAGTHGQFLYRAALQSMKGLIANDPEEAIYLPIRVDQNGDKFDGDSVYSLKFESGQLPPARDFWSLTAYNDDGNLILNPIDRYAVGNRSQHLIYGEDGSLTLYFSKEAPEGKESNWLPIDTSETILMMRLYGPEPEVLDRSWLPQEINKIERASIRGES